MKSVAVYKFHFIMCILGLIFLLITVNESSAKELMALKRGITFDRQFRQMPVESYCRIHSADITLVKKMGFDFVKVLINPALMMNSDGTINTANIGYVDELVNTFVNVGLPVVACIHPESDFKYTYIGSSSNFPKLLVFYHDFAAYLAARWGRDQLAFELMTEPFGNYTSWNTMLPQMWLAARKGMPDNILILDADGCGDLGHLVQLTPVDDDNVYYSFTTYAPLTFTHQGAYWMGDYRKGLQRVPYPSSPEIIVAEKPRILVFIAANGLDVSEANSALTAYGNERWNKSRHLAMLDPLVTWNKAHGGNRKFFCAEFGVLDANQTKTMNGIDSGPDPAARIQFIKDRREAFEERSISWSYWSFNEAFTVLDPTLRTTFDANPDVNMINNPTVTALGLPAREYGRKVQPSSSAKKIPVILDTDIADDIDDTWALALLLKCPELDVKLITTASGDTKFRAQFIAKMLETCGRTDIPIGIGKTTPNGKIHNFYQQCWLYGYNMANYKGKVYEDGVGAMVNTIMESNEPVTIIAIAPLVNLDAALERNPAITKKSRIIGMQGNIRPGFDGNDKIIAEWNVKTYISEAQKVFESDWPMMITPLDTCGMVIVDGNEYQKVLRCKNSQAAIINEGYRCWLARPGFEPDRRWDVNKSSTIVYDTVAVYLALSTDLVEVETLGIKVDDYGYTRISENAKKIKCATRWKDMDAYKRFLVSRLVN